MQRHDGTDLLPAIFAGQHPTMEQAKAIMQFGQEATNWNLASLTAQILLVAEVIRTFPAEIRMFSRLIKRKKPNMAETLFLLIKYLALIAVIFDILISATNAPQTDFQCHSWAWTASSLYFVCSSLVFCVIVWRAQIIFRTFSVARYLFIAGLVGQFAIAMWTNYRVDKLDAMSPAGTCVPRKMLMQSAASSAAEVEHVWESSTFWFILYNTVFDLAIMVAGCLRLIKTSSGPGGLTKIAKVLFFNNIHYMFGVESCNLIELIMLVGWVSSLPPLHQTSIAVQIVIGLQMLIGEQEAVYTPTYTKPGYMTGSNNYSRPTISTASSDNTKVGSFFKRPGTANTCTEFAPRDRKGTFSSAHSQIVTRPFGVLEEPPQVPPKAGEGVHITESTDFAIDMVNQDHIGSVRADHQCIPLQSQKQQYEKF